MGVQHYHRICLHLYNTYYMIKVCVFRPNMSFKTCIGSLRLFFQGELFFEKGEKHITLGGEW